MTACVRRLWYRCITLVDLPHKVMAKILARVLPRDERKMRQVSKKMRRMVDMNRPNLWIHLKPWMTVEVLTGLATRYLSLEKLSLTGVNPNRDARLLEVPQMLPLLTLLELKCRGPWEERRGWREGLNAATRLTRLTLFALHKRDLLVVSGCTGLCKLTLHWEGPGLLTPEAIPHMPCLEELRCSGLGGPDSLAFLQGRTSLTSLCLQVKTKFGDDCPPSARYVPLSVLAHLPGLRHLCLDFSHSGLDPLVFSHCLAPACMDVLERLELRAWKGPPNDFDIVNGLKSCRNLTHVRIEYVDDPRNFTDVLGSLPRLHYCRVESFKDEVLHLRQGRLVCVPLY